MYNLSHTCDRLHVQTFERCAPVHAFYPVKTRLTQKASLCNVYPTVITSSSLAMALFSEKYPLSDFGNAQHKKIANDHIGQEQSGIYNDNAADSYG